MYIAPSILTADFLHLGNAVEMINQSDADFIHLDIMDGHFVPNMTFGFPVIKQIKSVSNIPLDTHLMISNPDEYIQNFHDSGADILTVHYETCPHLHRTVQNIKELGMKAAVSLNPATPVQVLEEILPELYMVLVMSVNPGFGAQKFIPNTVQKIEKLKKMITARSLDTLIEIDGGVNLDNIGLLTRAGVDIFVVGNTVFSAENPVSMISNLKKLSLEARNSK